MRVFILSLIAGLIATPVLARDHRVGESFRDRPETPRMRVIPAGSAMLGSTEAETTREARTPAFAAWEHPRREVTFTRPFAVGQYHVTRREFAVFAKATGRALDGCVIARDGKWSDGPVAGKNWSDLGFTQRADEPALCVSWDDANAYAEWISQQTGAHYRLLTEDEWEYAARAGTTTARWWGDDAASICARVNGGDQDYAAEMPGDKSANLGCSDGFAYTSPVGRFAPNPWGLHDMFGNAWQWTADCFAPVIGTAPVGETCKTRSIRGGSWHNSVSTLRAATRFSLPPTMRSSSIGFRVMRVIP